MRRTVKHTHFLLALSGILFLGGCAMPPVVMVASYAIDGVSFIVSGKSISDHAISAALKKDCSLIRVIAGRQICVDAKDGTSPPVVVAAIPGGDNWTGDAVLALVGEPELELAAMTRGSEVPTPEKLVEAFRRSRPQDHSSLTLAPLRRGFFFARAGIPNQPGLKKCYAVTL